MKFPRNARIFRGQLDMAPFAGVFLLLVLFLMLSTLVYTPGGVPLRLPLTEELPGPETPTVAVGVDANGRLYFNNLSTNEAGVSLALQQAAAGPEQPMTLILMADKAVSYDTLVHLWVLARTAGISNVVLATLPRPFSWSKPGSLP